MEPNSSAHVTHRRFVSIQQHLKGLRISHGASEKLWSTDATVSVSEGHHQ